MPEAQITNRLSPRQTVRPRCPLCQAPMKIQRVAPGRPGFEHWTLRCTKCGLIHEAQAHADPLKSEAPGETAMGAIASVFEPEPIELMKSALDGEAILPTKAEQTSAMKVKPPSPKAANDNQSAWPLIPFPAGWFAAS